ncbi:aminotransferase class V-fold PLP-dependent enzyme, partial [Acinetobacter nosocomialis]|uniref:aminotransferase class V-fold PLP-dependent enzyme n=1 Tax=Acinetobacter nosocomialis TaxID=106654 RepID=UPI0013D5D1B6
QESQPDNFVRFNSTAPLLQARQAIAELVQAPLETITFVQNASTGTNIVLRNLEWEEGDVILTCETIYGAANKT